MFSIQQKNKIKINMLINISLVKEKSNNNK